MTFSLAAALLLAALLAPLATRLCRLGVPSALAALASIVVLLGFPTGVGLLLYSRVSQRVDDLGATVTAGIDDVRSWLITGPLALDQHLASATSVTTCARSTTWNTCTSSWDVSAPGGRDHPAVLGTSRAPWPR